MKRCRPLLGTYVEISFEMQCGVSPTIAFDDAFAAIALVGSLMSFHSADSELTLINAAPAGAVLRLHRWTVQVLTLCQEIHMATAGLFDCGVGARLARSGLLPKHRGAQSTQSALSGTILDVQILDAQHVRLNHAVCLDLGGIAKGFAVDRAVDALVSHNLTTAMVNAGGDLRVVGDVFVPLFVRHPDGPGRFVQIGEIANGAAATSACYFLARSLDEVARPGLIDPRDGTSVRNLHSCTVLAPLCAVADGLTKPLAIQGLLPEEALNQYGASTVVL